MPRALFRSVLTLFLVACDPSSEGDKAPSGQDSDPPPVDSGGPEGSRWYMDDDQDGYGADDDEGVVAVSAPEDHVDNNLDCDDSKTNVSPDAQEMCNGRDDDCDGLTDGSDARDAERWYRDADGDGFGDPDEDIFDCEPVDGYTDDATDCDDSDAAVYPNAEEICNEIDDDCDGDIDDDTDERATGYLDADGDGYGDVDERYGGVGCDASLPEGYVSNYLDCDDSAALVHPGGVEVCGDETDENCDGTPSDCEFWGRHGMHEADALFWQAGTTEDVGGAVVAQDVDGDGLSELWIGAANSVVDGVESGQVFLVAGTGTGEIELGASSRAEVHGTSEDARIGIGLADAGDVDGDGYPDIWLGAHVESSDTVTYAGSASLMLGPLSGSFDIADAEQRWFGEVPGERVGGRLGGGDDLDGDGTPDALIGAFFRNTGADYSGSVFVVYQSGRSGTLDVTDADVEIYGDMADDLLGVTTRIAGDTNGDGWSDLLLGAEKADTSGTESGAAYVVEDLPASGVYAVSELAEAIGGEATDDRAGGAGAPLGDLNGDGYADVGVGASYQGTEHTGAVYVLYGPVGGRTSLSDADVRLYGVDAYEYTSEVSGGQDLDADGSGDLLIGAYYHGFDGFLGGKAYLVRGPLEEGSLTLDTADAVFYGTDRDDQVGSAVALVPDANGDGYADALVGAPSIGMGGDSYGAAFLILGQAYP